MNSSQHNTTEIELSPDARRLELVRNNNVAEVSIIIPVFNTRDNICDSVLTRCANKPLRI